MLDFKNRYYHEAIKFIISFPTDFLGLDGLCLGCLSLWFFRGPLNTRFGNIQSVFSQSSFVLKANCWRVNTLDPHRKHLSHVCLVLILTCQSNFSRRVLKFVDGPTNYTKFKNWHSSLFSHRNSDPQFHLKHCSAIEILLKYIFKKVKYMKEFEHRGLEKNVVFFILHSVLSVFQGS